MQRVISENVQNRIFQFYQNARLKYSHTYSAQDSVRDANKVYDELYKVGTNELLKKNNSVIRSWSGYLVDYSKATGWYFAYEIRNNIIFIEEAENFRNMSEIDL